METIDDERPPAPADRETQEHEIALTHLLSELEHTLALEAAAVAFAFRDAGLDLDPLTIVALRIVGESCDACINSVDFLTELSSRGFFERAVGIADRLLLDDAA